MRRRPWSVRSRGRCSACGSASGLAVTEDEDCVHILTNRLDLGIKTHPNGTLTSTSSAIRVNSQRHCPPTKRPFKETFGSHKAFVWGRTDAEGRPAPEVVVPPPRRGPPGTAYPKLIPKASIGANALDAPPSQLAAGSLAIDIQTTNLGVRSSNLFGRAR